jgi:hypothetical protein
MQPNDSSGKNLKPAWPARSVPAVPHATAYKLRVMHPASLIDRSRPDPRAIAGQDQAEAGELCVRRSHPSTHSQA